MDMETIRLIAKAEELENQARIMLGYANNYRAEAKELMSNLPTKTSDTFKNHENLKVSQE